MIRLKELRNDKKMTLKSLSNDLKLSPQVLSRYELGQTQPDFDTLVRLADYFNVTVDYLLGRDTSTVTPAQPVGYELTQEEWQLIQIYRDLNEPSRELARSVLYTMQRSTTSASDTTTKNNKRA